MAEATIRRLHAPICISADYPPMPSRIRLAAHCWERVWWMSLVDSISHPDRLTPLVSRFSNDKVSIRAQMRTRRRICIAITTEGLDEQSEFELAMLIMAHISRELGEIERIEDRPLNMWPIQQF